MDFADFAAWSEFRSPTYKGLCISDAASVGKKECKSSIHGRLHYRGRFGIKMFAVIEKNPILIVICTYCVRSHNIASRSEGNNRGMDCPSRRGGQGRRRRCYGGDGQSNHRYQS